MAITTTLSFIEKQQRIEAQLIIFALWKRQMGEVFEKDSDSIGRAS